MRDSKDEPELLGGEQAALPDAADIARSDADAGPLPVQAATGRGMSSRRSAGYLSGIAGGSAFVLLGFFALLQLLGATGHLPPPALTNSVCIDEKLRFLRNAPDLDPNLLIVGSSVAWRGIDSIALQEAAAPGTRVLNGAFCGLHANQTRFVADWLLGHFTAATTVLMPVVPEDFTDCTGTTAALFDTRDADAYVFGRAWPWPFYFRYFVPASLLRNATRIAAQRDNRIPLDPLVFTRSGDGPLDTTVSRDTLGVGAMPEFDAACFAALHDMAAGAAGAGRRLTVIDMPIKPEWSRRYDPDGRVHDLFLARVRSALEGTGGQSWDAPAHDALPDAAFTDAIHLRWSAVPGLSRLIGRQVLPAGSS